VIEATVLTPPELAKRWRCKAETVHTLIRRGSLRAFDLGTATRPRWRISIDAILEFENRATGLRHSETARPRHSRRRKEVENCIEFF
jgi:hypothetical protein